MAGSKPRRVGTLEFAVVGTLVVELNIADRASNNTIGRVLRNSQARPAEMGHSTQANRAFVAAMEDVLASIGDRALLIACWSRLRFPVLAARWKPVIEPSSTSA